jgi:hypothetical protein
MGQKMRIKSLLLLVATACGLLASLPAQAVTYTYVGSWEVDQLSWAASSNNFATLPIAFTGQEAAAYLFGGSASEYVISTTGSDPNDINFSNWVTSWGCSLCAQPTTLHGTIVADNFVIGTSNPSGSAPSGSGTVGGGPYYAPGNGTSALLDDWAIGPQFTNYAFLVTGVPEPSTWAMMILGFAGIGFLAYRRQPTLMTA